MRGKRLLNGGRLCRICQNVMHITIFENKSKTFNLTPIFRVQLQVLKEHQPQPEADMANMFEINRKKISALEEGIRSEAYHMGYTLGYLQNKQTNILYAAESASESDVDDIYNYVHDLMRYAFKIQESIEKIKALEKANEEGLEALRKENA